MTDDLDRLLLGGEQRYTAVEVVEQAGVDPDLARRFWRALGFADVPEEARVFTDADLRALRTMADFLEQGIEPDVAVQQTRIFGSSART